MKPRIISLIVGLGLITSVFAQDIDYLTGRAVVSVPLFSLSVGSLNENVSLYYNGEGIRVGQENATAGMGWELQVGGAIYRQVNGLPDDLDVAGNSRKGWLHGSVAQTVNSFAQTSMCGSNTTLNSITHNDTEADLYTINAPGLNATFYFNATKNITFFGKSDLKVTYTVDGLQRINGFIVTTGEGTTYTFSGFNLAKRKSLRYKNTPLDGNHSSYSIYADPVEFYQSWMLGSIKDCYNNYINYIYEPAGESQDSDYFQKVKADKSGIDTIFSITTTSRNDLLSTISTAHESASLYWTAGVIGKIVVTDIRTQIRKEVILNYGHIRNKAESKKVRSINGFEEVVRYTRHFLKEIIYKKDCEPAANFSFDYYGVDYRTGETQLIFKNNYPQDYWGFYNAAPVSANVNAALVPDVYENVNDPIERFRIEPKPGWTKISGNGTRVTSPTTVAWGSLKRITLPTGGYTEYTYEAADYFDAGTGTSKIGGGLRVAAVKTSAGDNSPELTRVFQYKLANGQSSGRFLVPPVFAFVDGNGTVLSPVDLAVGKGLLYTRVTELLEKRGKTVFEFSVPAIYPETTYNGEWSATPMKHSTAVDQQNACIPPVSMGPLYYSFPFAPNMNYDFERGLLKTIEDFNETGQLVRLKRFDYVRVGIGEKTKSMRWDFFNDITKVYGQYERMGSTHNMIQRETVEVYDTVDVSKKISSITSNTYNSTGYLAETTSTNSDGNTYKTVYKYVFDFAPPAQGTQPNVLMLKELTLKNRLREPIEVIQFINGVAETAQLSLYRNDNAPFYYRKEQQSYFRKSPAEVFTPAFVDATLVDLKTDAKYQTTQVVESVTSNGQLVTTTDYTKAIHSAIYGQRDNAVVKLRGARPGEVIFADFEHEASTQIGSSSVQTSNDAWSGQKSYSWNGALLTKTVQRGTGSRYRFSCWAKATTSSPITITIIANGSSTTLTYPVSASGKWTLLEKSINVSTAVTSFSFQMSSTSTLLIDDVAFFPEASQWERVTVKPFAGVTSATTESNKYTFSEFDAQGRIAVLRDHNKHIVKSYKYAQAIVPYDTVIAAYTCTAGAQLTCGVPVTFSALENCETGIDFQWKVDGQLVGTNSPTLTHTFPSLGQYRVSLVASKPGGNSQENSFDWAVSAIPAPLTILNPEGDIHQCSDVYERTFTALSGNTSCLPADAGFLEEWYWEIKTNQTIDWVAISSWKPGLQPNQCFFSATYMGLTFTGGEIRCTHVVTDTKRIGYTETQTFTLNVIPEPNCN